MKSSTILSLLAVAAVISIPLSGCSSDEEPQSAVAPDYRIGLSAESVVIGDDMSDPEEISVENDGWKLSYVAFGDSHNAYVCNLSSSDPFAFQKEWLSIEYADKTLKFTAVLPNLETETRYARIELVNGSVTETVVCGQATSLLGVYPEVKPDPNHIVFPKDGGSMTVTTDWDRWTFGQVVLDGQTFTYPDNTPFVSMSQTFDWLSVDREGGSAENGSYDFVVTVAPNHTGHERTFDIKISSLWNNNVHVTGVQVAE